jgi:hypothetical protein
VRNDKADISDHPLTGFDSKITFSGVKFLGHGDFPLDGLARLDGLDR